MGRGSESFQKRQREKNKRERAAAKQARRHGKLDELFEDEEQAPSSNGKSEAELYEDFRLLSEKFQSGGMDEETYEQRRAEIFEQLGLEVH